MGKNGTHYSSMKCGKAFFDMQNVFGEYPPPPLGFNPLILLV